MNYISQIRAFYDALLVRPLSAGQIALWHGLMDRCNRLGWPEWFTAANISLESSCSLSRKGIYDSRNSLKQAGLINFRSNGTKAASYKIIPLYSTQATTQVTTQATTQVTTQATTQATTQVTATLLKPKHKPKQKGQEICGALPTHTQRFVPPKLEDVTAYCRERGNAVDPERFVNFYESKGWMVGKNKMKSWQACVRTWEKDAQSAKPETAMSRVMGDGI